MKLFLLIIALSLSFPSVSFAKKKCNPGSPVTIKKVNKRGETVMKTCVYDNKCKKQCPTDEEPQGSR